VFGFGCCSLVVVVSRVGEDGLERRAMRLSLTLAASFQKLVVSGRVGGFLTRCCRAWEVPCFILFSPAHFFSLAYVFE